jgi:hypothetical protein
VQPVLHQQSVRPEGKQNSFSYKTSCGFPAVCYIQTPTDVFFFLTDILLRHQFPRHSVNGGPLSYHTGVLADFQSFL